MRLLDLRTMAWLPCRGCRTPREHELLSLRLASRSSNGVLDLDYAPIYRCTCCGSLRRWGALTTKAVAKASRHDRG